MLFCAAQASTLRAARISINSRSAGLFLPRERVKPRREMRGFGHDVKLGDE
jgi:hypothetical protein